MGESKRKRDRLSPVQKAAIDLTHSLADSGLLVEGGFAAYTMIHKIDPSDPRMPSLRDAYMAGAEHLWSSVMMILDPGEEPTQKNLDKMTLIHNEIDRWRKMKESDYAQSYKTKGSA
jgi:hypothetical protein